MLHAAVLRSPHARARVTKLDLEPALATAGVRGVIGPSDLEPLTEEPNYEGEAIAAAAADTVAQARAAVETIGVEWEVLEPLLDAEQALAQKSFVGDPRDYERGDVE